MSFEAELRLPLCMPISAGMEEDCTGHQMSKLLRALHPVPREQIRLQELVVKFSQNLVPARRGMRDLMTHSPEQVFACGLRILQEGLPGPGRDYLVGLLLEAGGYSRLIPALVTLTGHADSNIRSEALRLIARARRLPKPDISVQESRSLAKL
ncbi:MAG: hypothetical protein HYZ37_19080 [Candidatus Solibacter usitatus]|nr:hypothetical protein [Candidatus Solibacter usitatus]